MNPVMFPWFGHLVVIAPECMGFRSVTALIIVSLWIAWRNRARLGLLRTLAVLAMAIAIGFAGNLLRIGIILAAAIFFPDFAFGPLHDVIGFVIILGDIWLLDFLACDFVQRCEATPGLAPSTP